MRGRGLGWGRGTGRRGERGNCDLYLKKDLTFRNKHIFLLLWVLELIIDCLPT